MLTAGGPRTSYRPTPAYGGGPGMMQRAPLLHGVMDAPPGWRPRGTLSRMLQPQQPAGSQPGATDVPTWLQWFYQQGGQAAPQGQAPAPGGALMGAMNQRRTYSY